MLLEEIEKMAIVKLLFDTKVEESIGVIPIVGVGGLGKTTLAQLVINDPQVKHHFKLITWVNVPKVFDVELVAKEIIKSGVKDGRSTENIPFHQLIEEVREKIKGKKYLMVLDDVWEIKSREKWLELENLLRDGAVGSRIIVTTRDKMVAHIINGPKESTYFLGTLDEKKSWSLFKNLAFIQGQEPDNPNHVEIGKEIMKKCGGIPLVIRTIASLLYSLNVEEWSSFKENELSAISQYDEDIIPRLKLSYDHLPSHLKNCFSYCSLFPKNHVFNVQKLIKLWMAQGFIKSSNLHPCLEDIGYKHFKDLLYRSFFEEVEVDDCFNVTKCKMHDCMHDVAMSVAGRKSLLLSLNDERIDERIRHVSFNFYFDSLQQFPSLLVKTKRIRTFLLNDRYYSSTRRLEKSILDFKLLRTLDLHNAGLEIIPKSVGKLKHLRYLDLSYNDMVMLPNSIARLQNLQTLKLTSCDYLRALPRDITKLVNLRHLNTKDCKSLTHMPRGLGQLTNLQTLPLFQLKLDGAFDSRHVGNLNELENLNSLRGNLEIVVKKDRIECQGANLKDKQHLKSLKLYIEGEMVDGCEDLVPHPNIKVLKLIAPYVGVGLLNCISSLHNLVELELWGHKECRYVAALSHLPNLKVVHIRNLPVVEYISMEKYDNIVDGSSSPFFPSLRSLWLDDMPNLKGWWKVDDDVDVENKRTLPFFPCLSQLSISDCPDLTSMPTFPFLQESLHLEDTSIKVLQETLMLETNAVDSCSTFLPLSNLKALYIACIEDLQHFPEGFKNLTSLKQLTITECSNLQSLAPGIHHLTSLQQLDVNNCDELDMPTVGSDDAIRWQHLQSLSELTFYELPKLVALPQGLQQVTSLRYIEISRCENLEDVLQQMSNLKSLKELSVKDCPKLKSLPEGIDCLTSLQGLTIYDCPILLERCREDTGDYWPKISHIELLDLSI
ncbi:putative disease resistance protein RGA3 [Ziziphus jujuba]|uniref:Disease resistance protein RGA3 n=1 Tax=Ziziphus jujuba TaxID=326968 RepID=A0ABM3IIT8_ZIZJJ|nr:putative disease resistance protein RGA3 [Ziziphus jujuba]XP_048329225.2 putative disease resistance protein RGA3 [Ziziphus jujuba]